MALGLVVFRRDLPGGHIVTVSLDQRTEHEVVGRLQIERRTDPSRRTGEPPIVAEARGATRDAVLAELRRIAESDAELSQRLEEWYRTRAAPVGLPSMSDFAQGAPHRLRMPDGQWWSAERRHEMAQLHSGRRPVPDRRIYVFFTGPGGSLRRAEVREGFPPAPEADPEELVRLWAGADILVL